MSPEDRPTEIPDADLTGVDPTRVAALAAAENARFVAERPKSMALSERARRSMPRGVPMAWMDDLYDHPPTWVVEGEGATFTDVDGHTYVDFYIADMSGFCGHAPPPVVAAVGERMRRGNQFLLPDEDAIVVAEHLAQRYRLPKWQFTLSGTLANTEVIRLARALTGREVILLFDGKYHGEGDSTLVIEEDGRVVPEQRGLPPWVADGARISPSITRCGALRIFHRATALVHSPVISVSAVRRARASSPRLVSCVAVAVIPCGHSLARVSMAR